MVSSSIALVLAGVAAVVAVHFLASHGGQPAAALLVLAGLGYSLLPGPNLTLRPGLILELVIPPLLYATALNSSVIALRKNVRAIASLSVGLVVVSALAVGGALSAAVPSVPLAAGLALGAAVAPPDPVAALAVGRRAGLPPRLVTLIEGEGLLNDATALTILGVASAAAVGHHVSVAHGVAAFLIAVVGGTVAGLIVAVVLGTGRRWLKDPLAENAVSLATPFAAYLLAELIHGSGVLAVVVAGLWFAHRAPTFQSSQSRLQTRAVWRLIEYLLEGFVFLLIGQQLPRIVDGLRPYSIATIAAAAAVTLGSLLVLRPLWIVLTARLGALLRSRGHGDEEPAAHGLSRGQLIALSWSGMRGVITLAAAFTLPKTMSGGGAFPARDLLIFCAYTVVLITLVGQGLTFAPLLRRLRLSSPAGEQAVVRNQARLAAVEAALDRLGELVETEDVPGAVAGPLREELRARRVRYNDRLQRLSAAEDGSLPPEDPDQITQRVRHLLIEAQREEVVQWRDTGRLPDVSLRILLHELDHEEGRLPHTF